MRTASNIDLKTGKAYNSVFEITKRTKVKFVPHSILNRQNNMMSFYIRLNYCQALLRIFAFDK